MRDYRAFLTGVKGYKAATVNAYLAPLRAIVRDQGRTLKVKGVRQTRPLIETLDGRDLGRLINALDGPDWQDKRDVALINVLARAGLRVSEALALKVGDVEINARSGALLVQARQRAEGASRPAVGGGQGRAERLPQGAAACCAG